MGEKTEEATPKKLEDARKKGQVAKSQDFPSVFTFAVSIGAVIAGSSWIYEKVGGFLVSIFKGLPQTDILSSAHGLFFNTLLEILIVSLPFLIIVSFIGVLVNFLVTGPVFSFEVFKPDIKKFNPVTNIKNKFKMKTLVELLKSLFKVFGASYIVYRVVEESLPVLTTTVSMSMFEALQIFNVFLIKVVIRVGLFFLAIAIFDLFYQRMTFKKEMKMEKHEVKQEHKNTEGDPEIKGKRKEIAREIAYSDGPGPAVKKSKAIITNPTHIAVGIAYDKTDDLAPWVTIKGTDLLARRIVEIAQKEGVPVMQNIPLAHLLLDEGTLYRYVPKKAFEPLAEILRWIEKLERGENPDENPLEVELD